MFRVLCQASGVIDLKSHQVEETKRKFSKHGFIRNFHTTPSRHVNVAFILLKQVFRTVSLQSGRKLRASWRNLSTERQQHLLNKYFRNPRFWALPLGVIVLGGTIFYVNHLQTTPVTNRERFILFNNKRVMQMSDMIKKLELEQGNKIVDPDNVVHIRVSKVVERLIKRNMDIEKIKAQEWTLHVIDKDIENAFVLANGHIFIYTGLLKVMKNDDQLAFILGHEMAHAILDHTAETLTFSGVIILWTAAALALFWLILPDALAIFMQVILSQISKSIMDLPYSRKLELEADEVGLELVAKACYDVRESSNLLKNLSVVSTPDTKYLPSFLFTHPTHESRAEELDRLMTKALERRKECNCPTLDANAGHVLVNVIKSVFLNIPLRKQ